MAVVFVSVEDIASRDTWMGIYALADKSAEYWFRLDAVTGELLAAKVNLYLKDLPAGALGADWFLEADISLYDRVVKDVMEKYSWGTPVKIEYAGQGYASNEYGALPDLGINVTNEDGIEYGLEY